MSKKYKCPYCEDRYIRKDLINHIDKEHEEMIPQNFTSSQVVYDIVNKTNGHGKCRVCGRSTPWNQSAGRYDVLCGSQKCKDHMREEYKKNMLKVHGTYNMLNDADQQKKMLANRSISGKYKFSDGGVLTYTGSYEKKFLEFADKVMQIPSKDIMAPGPTLEYEINGVKHFYITDFLYIPYNAIIEIKDGGSNPNTKDSDGMRSSRLRTMEKEKLITNKGEYNYLRLTDNNFVQLLDFFMQIKDKLINGDSSVTIRINEFENYFSNKMKKFAISKPIIVESVKSTLDTNYTSKGKKKLSSFKRVRITESVIDKYKKEYSFLKHVRYKDTKEYICDGYIWFYNDELVAMVGSCEYRDDKTKWIVSLEITDKYKGHGLSKQILDYAVKSMNCKYLSVNKSNEVAKKVYDDYGFKVYQESDKMYYMTIDKVKSVKEETLLDNPPKHVYHISFDEHNGETFYPRYYENENVSNGMERKVKRVCFSDSITRCLYSIFPEGAYDADFYVYVPDNEVKVYRTTTDDIYDSDITHELWVKEPVVMKCIGKIHVYGISDKTHILDVSEYDIGYNKKKYHENKWRWIEKKFDDESLYE